MRAEIIAMDDSAKSENAITVDIAKVAFCVYGNILLTKKQVALTKSKKSRVRNKWLRVFDKRFTDMARRRMNRYKITTAFTTQMVEKDKDAIWNIMG